MTSPLHVSIGGQLWWNGFTAELKITNTSSESLASWSYSFTTPHTISGVPWGVTTSAEQLANGQTNYTLIGSDWAQSIPAGGFVTVGFNAQQGKPVGNAGALTAELLISTASETATSVEPSSPVSDSTEVEMQGDEQTDNNSSDDIDIAMNDGDHEHMHMAEISSDYIDITSWGSFHGSNDNSEHNELVGGRTAITTEALEAYNALRMFSGLEAVTIEAVGEWAFANGLTNNSQAWGNDEQGVGLWYAMQGAKVGWIADEAYDPQILADIQRTARLGDPADAMAMVEEFGHQGFAEYLQSNQLVETFINTLKMEPHYGGWMHGRTHGFLDIEGGAIAHDINHLTVLGWDQSEPFMNDTFDWPQWPALDVSDQVVIDYFQSMVSLGGPLGSNLEAIGTPINEEDEKPQQEPVVLVEQSQVSQIDPITGSAMDVEVSGDLWWGGFTAEITITNSSDQRLENWAVGFNSTHRFYGESWGVDVATEEIADDLYSYKIYGADWGQSIGAGQSMTVGFNALTGMELERSGSLTAESLFAEGSELVLL
ncbi:Cellulose binding domain protein [Prochlorococcus marinus str. MIT 1318]|uniref:cellulose binding domain-containing protein n=1 Tax=Prochlorococcus TaxID=1218 RepID=UPI0007B368CA|nr:cellulose binding domain-containing protein [Prochlorococcus marinus]KZR71009.1 Cellulose binding domain protein [Prochlorococcus marinus str. MIT 1318]